MKRFLAIFIGIIMILSFTACGKKDESNSTSNSSSVRESETVSESKNNGTESDKTDSSGSDNENSVSESGDEEKKILVAYFSATNNTERIAGIIASITGGTIFELTPVNPYTQTDLNYNSSTSRVSREHNDESLRDIELTVVTPEKWNDYDVVFIGYPIWWGIAAWPVNNFVKGNDFTGKTVIPFATAASSPIGNSASLLQQMAGMGNWLAGKCFYSGSSDSTVQNWINDLDF